MTMQDDRLFDLAAAPPNPSDLTERWLIPPFTILNKAGGDWQDRRRHWLGLGIESHEGREARAINMDMLGTPATSVFDPVIAEVMYAWHSRPGDTVYDPFAGGSVRGLVAYAMGRNYIGRDVRPEQIAANVNQLTDFDVTSSADPPRWDHADGTTGGHPARFADLVLTCPPYGDLEVYSDRPDDISNRSEAEFVDAIYDAVTNAVAALHPNRFAVWVVGNYRHGGADHMTNLVGHVVDAHRASDAMFLGDYVLREPAGTAPMRANLQFPKSRKPVKTHQNVLVFWTGSLRAATHRLATDKDAS